MPRSLNKVIQANQEPDDITVHLRAKNQQLEAANDDLRKQLGGQKELAALVQSAVRAVNPYPRAYKQQSVRKGQAVVPVFLDSDWHIGEVTSASETEGFGAYDFKIAKKRLLDNITEAEIRWATKQRNAYHIDEAVVIGIGDYISGDIHRELIVTNEFPLPVQTAEAGALFAERVRRIAANFERVRVIGVGADNHGRLTPKPQAKQKYQNSMSYLVHAIAKAALANVKNVVFEEAQGLSYLAEIAAHKFLIMHGDTIKSQLSIPYYGVSRLLGREARRRMNTPLGFDYQLIGHFHVPALVEGQTIINGSLSGCSEFDHSCGRYAPPSQVAFMVHPKHGLFNFTAFGAE